MLGAIVLAEPPAALRDGRVAVRDLRVLLVKGGQVMPQRLLQERQRLSVALLRHVRWLLVLEQVDAQRHKGLSEAGSVIDQLVGSNLDDAAVKVGRLCVELTRLLEHSN